MDDEFALSLHSGSMQLSPIIGVHLRQKVFLIGASEYKPGGVSGLEF
jgi:hypothetical protein